MLSLRAAALAVLVLFTKCRASTACNARLLCNSTSNSDGQPAAQTDQCHEMDLVLSSTSEQQADPPDNFASDLRSEQSENRPALSIVRISPEDMDKVALPLGRAAPKVPLNPKALRDIQKYLSSAEPSSLGSCVDNGSDACDETNDHESSPEEPAF